MPAIIQEKNILININKPIKKKNIKPIAHLRILASIAVS